MIRSVSLPRPDLSARGTQLALGAVALCALAVGIAVEVGTGNLTVALILLGICFAPVLVMVAIRWPYVFPYGLYVLLVPFDNMLKLGGSGTLTKMLGIATIVALVLYAIAQRRAIRPPKSVLIWTAFIVWNVVCLMWTPDFPEAVLYVQTLVSLLLLYAALSVAPIDEGQLRTVCGFVVAGGVLASLYGIYLLHNAPQMGGDYGRLMINVGDRRIDPNHFANSLLAPIALAFVGLLSARKAHTMLAAFAALAILIAGVLISLSRETLLGCLVMGFVVILLSRRRLIGLAIAVPALITVLLFVPTVVQRMSEAFSTGGAGRTALWHAAWIAFLQKPLFGWGTAGSIEAYDVNFFRVYQAQSVGWVITPHNMPLHIAVEVGIVGLVLFLLAYLSIFLQLRVVPRNDPAADLRVALTAAFVGLAFVSLFIDLATYKYVWLVMALIAQLRTVVLMRASTVAPRR